MGIDVSTRRGFVALVIALLVSGSGICAAKGGNGAAQQQPVSHQTPAQANQAAQAQAQADVQSAQVNASKAWGDYKAKFGKTYGANNSAEDQQRKAQFATAVNMIARENDRPGRAWTMGLGPFADMTKTEFLATKAGLNPHAPRNTTNSTDAGGSGTPSGGSTTPTPTTPTTVIPDAINWVALGKVAPIKEQGHCGSCWTFAATAAIESATAIADPAGALYSLAEQQILDCGSSRCDGANGCNGGGIQWGLDYVVANQGQTASTAYPYTGSGGEACNTQAAGWKVAEISGYRWVNPNSEADLVAAVASGPVMVGIAAGSDGIMYYGGGVYDDFAGCCSSANCQSDINHAVVVVGYNKTEGWWLVRNSWGNSWGVGGYIYMRMGTPSGSESGLCGILTMPVQPVKNSPSVISGTAPPGAALINLGLAGTMPAPASLMAMLLAAVAVPLLAALL